MEGEERLLGKGSKKGPGKTPQGGGQKIAPQKKPLGGECKKKTPGGACGGFLLAPKKNSPRSGAPGGRGATQGGVPHQIGAPKRGGGPLFNTGGGALGTHTPLLWGKKRGPPP